MTIRNPSANYASETEFVGPHTQVETVLRDYAHQEKAKRHEMLHKNDLEGIAWLDANVPRITRPVTYRVHTRTKPPQQAVKTWSIVRDVAHSYVHHYENAMSHALVLTPSDTVRIWSATVIGEHNMECGYLIAHMTTVRLFEIECPFVGWRFVNQCTDEVLTLASLTDEAGMVFDCLSGGHARIMVHD